MIVKAKWEDLKIGLPVKEYPEQNYWSYVRDIIDNKVFYSSDCIPNIRFFITKNKFGKEFNELYFDNHQLVLL